MTLTSREIGGKIPMWISPCCKSIFTRYNNTVFTISTQQLVATESEKVNRMIHHHHELNSSFSLPPRSTFFSSMSGNPHFLSIFSTRFDRYLPQLASGCHYQCWEVNLTMQKTVYHRPFFTLEHSNLVRRKISWGFSWSGKSCKEIGENRGVVNCFQI